MKSMTTSLGKRNSSQDLLVGKLFEISEMCAMPTYSERIGEAHNFMKIISRPEISGLEDKSDKDLEAIS
jgi:hypothetical protein